MAEHSDSSLDRLWAEYSEVFRAFDDLTLARWMAQTLGQFQGRVWRFSHPLVGAYRLAAQVAHERQVWLQRLATPPAVYGEAPCCRAPLLPLFTRDVLESGLICLHCSGTAVPVEEFAKEMQAPVKAWADAYAPVHAVAHSETQGKSTPHLDAAFEEAASRAEELLEKAARELLPGFIDYYPAVIWEDQDECLEVRPEDVARS